MGKLILVRHGETDLNRDKIFFGRLNPKLNETGIKQANLAKNKILDTMYDNIYSSPLLRAKETAEICNYLSLDIKYDNNLQELDFGNFEGLTFEEITKKFPTKLEDMQEKWKDFDFINGESPRDLYRRSLEFLKKLDYSKNNLIVSHWGVISCMLSYFVANSIDAYWKFKIENGGVVILEGDMNHSCITKFF